MKDSDRVKGIFAQYARLRQSRASREEAWKRVKIGASDLDEIERKRLLALVRDWEIIEGHKYAPERTGDPYATLYKPPEGLQALREQAKEQKAQTDPPAQTGKLTPTPVGLECPVCHKINAPGMARCECGALLPQTKDVAQEVEKISLAADKALFDSTMILKFEFPGSDQSLDVPLSGRRLVIGRRASSGTITPDIDLEPYDGQPMGVSRFHASLHWEKRTLVLTDLQSLNHTFVNSLRLYPHESRVLRDGDELRFGRLVVNIHFDHVHDA